ncbi:MAG: nuclear transport factor 2 family protein [Tepidisphaeraceae bacterium]
MLHAPDVRRLDRFKQALLQMETDRDPVPLVQQFADTVLVDTPAHEHPLVGRDGAATFWNEYLAMFRTIHTRFTQDYALNDVAVLEWWSEGTLAGGHPIDYRGVTILHFDGDLIDRFTAYFDSARFVARPFEPECCDLGTNTEGGD